MPFPPPIIPSTRPHHGVWTGHPGEGPISWERSESTPRKLFLFVSRSYRRKQPQWKVGGDCFVGFTSYGVKDQWPISRTFGRSAPRPAEFCAFGTPDPHLCTTIVTPILGTPLVHNARLLCCRTFSGEPTSLSPAQSASPITTVNGAENENSIETLLIPSTPFSNLLPEADSARTFLGSIASKFDAPIRYAFAYDSGVMVIRPQRK